MVKRTATAKNEEPEQSSFEIPSEKEHLLQVSDVFDSENDPHSMIDDPNIAIVKLEVVGGEEEGRTLLNRVCLDDSYKGFFATRLFLKAIGEPYKEQFQIDTDRWQGMQFYATVVHNEGKNNKVYANIKEYNFDKVVENDKSHLEKKSEEVGSDDIAWDE